VARIAQSLGDYERMRIAAQGALELSRGLGDERAIALCLNHLGIALSNLGDIDGGIACHEEAAAISRPLGDGMRLTMALNNLGYCRLRRGQEEEARALLAEGLAVARQIGHRTAESVMLGNLGLAALHADRPGEALAHFEAALEIDRDLGYTEGVIYGVLGLAAILPAPDAALLLGAADAAASALDVEFEPLELELHDRLTRALRDRHAGAYADGRRLSLDAAVARGLRLMRPRKHGIRAL
jgi:tetratricopeptide (TPR) repeat protein